MATRNRLWVGGVGVCVLCGLAAGQVRLEGQSTRVKVEGRFAVTTVDMEFSNADAEAAEAVVDFGLNPSAALFDLELWINDEPQRGEIVETDRAREVFDEYRRQPPPIEPDPPAATSSRGRRGDTTSIRTVRDPALLESRGGGRWQLRVFPVLPGQPSRVRFRYAEVLSGVDGWIRYRGPDWDVEGLGDAELPRRLSVTGRVEAGGGVGEFIAGGGLQAERARGKVWIRGGLSGRRSVPDVSFAYRPLQPQPHVIRFDDEQGRPRVLTVLDELPDAMAQLLGDRRHLVVVLDRSGAPEQVARRRVQAMAALAELDEGDTFSIVAVGGGIECLPGGLLKATRQNIEAAGRFVAGLQASDSSASDEARFVARLIQPATPLQPTGVLVVAGDGARAAWRAAVADAPAVPDDEGKFGLSGLKQPRLPISMVQRVVAEGEWSIDDAAERWSVKDHLLRDARMVEADPSAVLAIGALGSGVVAQAGDVQRPWEVMLARGGRTVASGWRIQPGVAVEVSADQARCAALVDAVMRCNALWDRAGRPRQAEALPADLVALVRHYRIACDAMSMLVLENDEEYRRHQIPRRADLAAAETAGDAAQPVRQALLRGDADEARRQMIGLHGPRRLLLQEVARQVEQLASAAPPIKAPEGAVPLQQPAELWGSDGRIAAWAPGLVRTLASGQVPPILRVAEATAGGRRFLYLRGLWVDVTIAAGDRVDVLPLASRAPEDEPPAGLDLGRLAQLGPSVLVRGEPGRTLLLQRAEP